jgi:hypothetical protein
MRAVAMALVLWDVLDAFPEVIVRAKYVVQKNIVAPKSIAIDEKNHLKSLVIYDK